MKKLSWSPDLNLNPQSRRRSLWIVSILVFIWFALTSAVVFVSNDEELLEEAAFKSGMVNAVEVTNDLSGARYFVNCHDEHCQRPKGSTEPGDYNLVTPGHVQKLQVPRMTKDKKVATFGVFDSNQTKLGCFHIELSKNKNITSKRNLSEVLGACEDSQKVFPLQDGVDL